MPASQIAAGHASLDPAIALAFVNDVPITADFDGIESMQSAEALAAQILLVARRQKDAFHWLSREDGTPAQTQRLVRYALERYRTLQGYRFPRPPRGGVGPPPGEVLSGAVCRNFVGIAIAPDVMRYVVAIIPLFDLLDVPDAQPGPLRDRRRSVPRPEHAPGVFGGCHGSFH